MVGVSLRSSIYNKIVSNWLWFPLTEGTGTTLNERSGDGNNATLTGAGSPWANAGYLTGDAVNSIAAKSLANAYHQSIYSMSGFYGQQLIIAFDQYMNAAPAASEAYCCFGELAASGGGGFDFRMTSGRVMQIGYRGAGASATTTTSFSSALTIQQRNALLFDFYGLTTTTVSIDMYVNGNLEFSLSPVDWMLNSATDVPLDSRNAGIGICCSNSGISSQTTYLSNAATSEGRMANLFALRKTVYDPCLAEKIAIGLYANKGDAPHVLEGV